MWPDKPIDPDAVKVLIENGLKSHDQAYLCAVENGEPIGFCSLTVRNNLWLEAKSGQVDELVVDARHRDRGVGRLLMEEIEKVARNFGCRRLDLESAAHRTPAHEFYRGLGFEKTEYSSFFFMKKI